MQVAVGFGGEPGVDLHPGKAPAGRGVLLDKLMNKILRRRVLGSQAVFPFVSHRGEPP